MSDRRLLPRNRVYYGGVVAFNDRDSTLACVVRNFSQFGAKIELESSAILPDEMNFTIERKDLSCPVRLVWRDGNAAGLAFRDLREDGVIPLEWARRRRASKRVNPQPQARLDQPRSEH